MQRFISILFFTLVQIVLPGLSSWNAVWAQDRPNVVIILADDLGYGDLSCYGSHEIQTPHIDRLASEGVKLTNFYANGPECTPTRTALLTGRYQQRVGGLECAIGLGNIGRYEEALALSNQGKLGLPTRFSVLPDIFKDQDYHTAIMGKWHLGEGEAYRPGHHQFDFSIGPLGGAIDYFHHTEPIGEFIGVEMFGDRDFYRNDVPDNRKGHYLTHLITDEAIAWLNQQKGENPFFLYLAYTAPHDPYQGPDDYRENPLHVSEWKDATPGKYKQMVEELDHSVGRVLDKIESQALSENTIVIFFSDNGPTMIGSTGDLRGNKGHVFEGGIKVPCIIKWPGKIDAAIIDDQPFISMDLTYSLATLMNSESTKNLDGLDIIQNLMDRTTIKPRDLFWRKKRAVQVRSAVRSSEGLKYIYEKDQNEINEYLFDLTADPSEKTNLITTHPELLKSMRKKLSEWEEDVQPERLAGE